MSTSIKIYYNVLSLGPVKYNILARKVLGGVFNYKQ